MSHALWAITGVQQKKFVLLISQTQAQAKLLLTNLKRELEGNQLLKKEVGPFEDKSAEWGSFSLVIPKYGARITVASSEQSIRGIRHGADRPDLIICDDVEDLNSVKTREGRDKAYAWLTGEVIPAGDQNTKVVIIGNLLHNDSLLMRLKENIESGKLDGIYREYPLVNEEGKILWPGKFRSMEDIDRLKLSVPNENAWQREYMLCIIPDEGQVIYPEWLHYYFDLPSERPRLALTGIDLAISEKHSAHYTAMVSAYVYGWGDKLRIYILPNPINERLDFPNTVRIVELLNKKLRGISRPKFYIEEVGYQSALTQQLKTKGIMADGFKPLADKRARLSLTADLIHSGKIVFPEQGAEKLIEQIVGIKKEKHDDLADAFSTLILKFIESNKFQGGVGVLIGGAPPFNMNDWIGKS
jgi:predicted phage terminase large subunit-like protein